VLAIQIAIAVIAAVTLLAAGIARIAAPGKLKTIFSGPGLRVVNTNHNGPAVARRTNEFLMPPAIYLIEPETRGIRGHGRCAVESPELWRRAAYVPKNRAISTNFHRCRTVDDNIQRTNSTAAAGAFPRDRRPPLHLLSAQNIQ
jgi:hypothetical protein